MPELLPWMRHMARSSKSPRSPPCQMRKVLCLRGLAAVLSPVMTPSRTDQNLGSPRQPVRSLPLNSGAKPDSSLVGGAALARNKVAITSAARIASSIVLLQKERRGPLRPRHVYANSSDVARYNFFKRISL